MAPHHGLDGPERNEGSRSNDDFDWGYLACAAPGLALFLIAVLIKACS